MPAAQRREQLLDAATALIAERGYWGLSLQDVADACGITLPGVLHHFGTKDGLLVAVLEYRDRLDEAALAEHLAERAGAGRTPDLGGVVEAIVARNAGQREIVRLYAVLEAESLTPDHPAHDFFAERQRRTLALLTRWGPPDGDREALARHVLALLDGLQLQWLRDPDLDLLDGWRAASRQVPALRRRPRSTLVRPAAEP
jgi:AcrR family transcriptional regulator